MGIRLLILYLSVAEDALLYDIRHIVVLGLRCVDVAGLEKFYKMFHFLPGFRRQRGDLLK